MAENKTLSRIYDLKVLGADAAADSVKKLSTVISSLDDRIRKMKGELASKTKAGDIDSVNDLTKKIKELETALKSTTNEKIKAAKEAEILAKAERASADAALKRTQATIAQDKELDRLIAKEEKEAAALKKQKAALDALEGSYKQVKNQLKELSPLIQNANSNSTISFGGKNLNFNEAIAEFKRLSAAEQDFRRQFAKDNTLVGEYTTGIINAFKNSGLDNLIKGQLDTSKKTLQTLNQEFDVLKKELSSIGVAANGNLGVLEKQLIENRNEAAKLEGQINELSTGLNGVGGIGTQITNTLNKGFKDTVRNIGAMAIAAVGFQQAVGGIRNVIDINFAFENKTNELKAITGVAGADLDFLKKKALETSSATKFSAAEILESFKLIASAKPELLQNVEGLNQVKDAAVLLAQASGQELPAAVDSLTKTLNQFGADASKSAEYVDALAAGAKFGAAEIPNITSALLEFGTEAKNSNVSVQESVGLIELLAEKGIVGADAGTKLRNVLLALNNASGLDKKAVASLEAAGVNMKILNDRTLPLQTRLQEFSKVTNVANGSLNVFGKENIIAGNIVLRNISRYGELAGQIKSTGIAQEQASDQVNNASTVWAKLRNQVTNLVTDPKVNSFLIGLATALGFVVANAGAFLGVLALLTVSFGLYRAQLTLAAFTQGTLNAQSFAYYALSRLQAAQTIILNGIQAAQNFLLSTYTAIVISANAATGASAVAIRALGIAFRFMTGPIGLVLTLTAGLVTIFGVLSANAGIASRSTADLVRQQREQAAVTRVNAELSERVTAATADQISKIRQYTTIASDATISDKTRRAALEELIKISPKYREALQGEAIDTEKLKNISDELVISLQKQARSKAIADLSAEKERKKFEIENKLAVQRGVDNKQSLDDKTGFSPFIRDLGSRIGLGKGTAGQQVRDLEKELVDVNDELKSLYQRVSESKEIQDAIVTNNDATANGTTIADPNIKAKKGAGDKIKTAEQLRDELIKQLDDEFNTKKNNLLLNKKSEEQYAIDLNNLVQLYADKKLVILNKAAEKERLRISEVNLDKLNSERDTNQLLFDLRSKAAEDLLKQTVLQSQKALDVVNDNPNSSDADKLQARQVFLNSQSQAQQLFNLQMDKIEKDFGVKSVENADKRKNDLNSIDRERMKNAYDIAMQTYQDILRLQSDAATKQRNEAETNAAQQTIDILSNEKLSPAQKANQIRKVELDNTKLLLAEEVAATKIALAEKEKALKSGLATELEVSEAKKNYKNAELALLKNTTDKELTFWEKIKKGFASSKEQIDEALNQASQSIKAAIDQAEQQYFDGQRQKIDQEKQAAYDRINIEQQQLEFVAQSEAEKESIRKKADIARKAADKKAGEEKKKLALQQATIDFASAVIKTFSLGLVGSLIASAGLLALYLIQRKSIQSQQFAEGGRVLPNGRITASPNIPTQANGDNVLATVRTGEVILNERQQRLLGGAATFSRIGVPGFASGGLVLNNSFPGSNLRPPIFTSLSSSNASDTQKLFDSIQEQQKMIVAQSFAISDMNRKFSTLKVQVVAKEVVDTDNNTKAASSVGTLK